MRKKGDWSSLEEMSIPEAYVNSCYFVKNLIYLEEIATVIGASDDIPCFKQLRTATEAAIKEQFYNTHTGSFAGDVQGADAFCLCAR